MDYWYALDVHHHENWDAFQRSPARPERLWLFTTKAARSFWDVGYGEGDGLLFGNEGAGCPEWLHAAVGEAGRVTHSPRERGDALAQSLDRRGHRLLRGAPADPERPAAGVRRRGASRGWTAGAECALLDPPQVSGTKHERHSSAARRG